MSPAQRYELLESLGKNDYLVVHRAWDSQIKRYVAVMALHDKFRKSANFDSIWEEVLFYANLNHYGLVRVYEALKSQGWIVVELMQGALRELAPHLNSDQVRGVLRTSLGALGYIHDHNKLHGDVRPANLLVDAQGYVRLSHPVGLALGGQVPKQNVDQRYIPPELIEPAFGESGPSTDLYRLGVAALDLLAGPNFARQWESLSKRNVKSSAGVADAQINWLRWLADPETRWPATSEMVPGVAADVASVVDRLLAKPVADRFSSASEALAGLSGDDSEVDLSSVIRTSQVKNSETSLKDERKPEIIMGESPMAPVGNKQQPVEKNVLQQITEDKRIFYPLAFVVLAVAAMIGLGLQAEEPKATGEPKVTLDSRVKKLEAELEKLRDHEKEGLAKTDKALAQFELRLTAVDSRMNLGLSDLQRKVEDKVARDDLDKALKKSSIPEFAEIEARIVKLEKVPEPADTGAPQVRLAAMESQVKTNQTELAQIKMQLGQLEMSAKVQDANWVADQLGRLRRDLDTIDKGPARADGSDRVAQLEKTLVGTERKVDSLDIAVERIKAAQEDSKLAFNSLKSETRQQVQRAVEKIGEVDEQLAEVPKDRQLGRIKQEVRRAEDELAMHERRLDELDNNRLNGDRPNNNGGSNNGGGSNNNGNGDSGNGAHQVAKCPISGRLLISNLSGRNIEFAINGTPYTAPVGLSEKKVPYGEVTTHLVGYEVPKQWALDQWRIDGDKAVLTVYITP